MLGRLGMTVDECLNEYLGFFERLVAEANENSGADTSSTAVIKSGILRATVSELVQARGLPSDGRLRNEDNVSCYT
jgi:hypothetical protein